MKVLFVEDHPLVQDAIRRLLERYYSPLTFVSAYNYQQASELVHTDSAYDLALFDLGLPDVQCFEGLTRICAALKTTPIVVLSGSEDPYDMRRALALGAKGYIPKSAPNEVIARALKVVLSGSDYIPRAALDEHHYAPLSTTGAANAYADAYAPGVATRIKLSSRQSEVLQLVITGKTNKEIGRTLNISDTTARTHVTAIFKALNVSNRTEACYAAARLGLWPNAPRD